MWVFHNKGLWSHTTIIAHRFAFIVARARDSMVGMPLFLRDPQATSKQKQTASLGARGSTSALRAGTHDRAESGPRHRGQVETGHGRARRRAPSS